MDNITESQRILDKKIDSYNTNPDNFVCDGEIKVTITINEYRKLVETSATTKSLVDAANKDKYERENENRKLIEENAKLKAELYELNKRIEAGKTKDFPEGGLNVHETD